MLIVHKLLTVTLSKFKVLRVIFISARGKQLAKIFSFLSNFFVLITNLFSNLAFRETCGQHTAGFCFVESFLFLNFIKFFQKVCRDFEIYCVLYYTRVCSWIFIVKNVTKLAFREPPARVPYEKHSTGMFFYPPALRGV